MFKCTGCDIHTKKLLKCLWQPRSASREAAVLWVLILIVMTSGMCDDMC